MKIKYIIITLLFLTAPTTNAGFFDFLLEEEGFKEDVTEYLENLGGGIGTLSQLSQWRATSTPVAGIAPNSAGKTIYSPYSDAYFANIISGGIATTTTLCFDDNTCFSTASAIQTPWTSNIDGGGYDLDNVGNATTTGLSVGDFTDVEHYWDNTQSAGWIEGFDFLDMGDGSFEVGAGSGILKKTISDTGENMNFHITATTTLWAVEDTTNYVYVDYNGGSPLIATSSTSVANGKTKFNLGLVFRENGTVYDFRAGQVISDIPQRIISRLNATGNITLTSGGLVAESGERYLTVTEPTLWGGIIRFIGSAIDTTGADTFEQYYSDGATGWTESDESQINNTNYDDGDGTLGTLGTNKYRTDIGYIDNDGHLMILMGTNNSSTLTSAQNHPLPTSLPPHISDFSTRVVQIIARQGSATLIEVNNIAGQTALASSGAVVHNETTGIQGGTTSEYYHLTSSEHTELNGWLDNAVLGSDGSLSGIPQLTSTNASSTLLTSTTSWLGNILSGIWNGTPIDIGTYTNLAVTDPIVLTDDTLSFNGVAPIFTATTTMANAHITGNLQVDGAIIGAFTITTTGKISTTGDLEVGGHSTLATASSTALTVSGDSFFNVIKSGTWNGTAIDFSDYTNATASTGITFTDDAISTNDGQIVHDNLSGFVANEHIDWTGASAGTIHTTNYVDNNTTYLGGTNLTLAGTTFNVDDAFLINDGNDATTGTITSAGLIVGDGQTVGATTYKWLFDDSNGDISTTGNVGVGTASPSSFYRLSVNNTGANSGGVIVTTDGYGSPVMQLIGTSSQTNDARGLDIQAGHGTAYIARFADYANSEKMIVTGAGNVGIGTVTPTGKLQIFKSVAGTLGLVSDFHIDLQNGNVAGNLTQMGFGRTAANYKPVVIGSELTSATGYSTEDFFIATRALTTDTAPIERMRIDSAGNIGIGTTSPATLLDVEGGIRPDKVVADPCGAGYPEATMFYNDTSDYYCFCTGAGVDVQMHSPTTACF